jgi:hypothetical protein
MCVFIGDFSTNFRHKTLKKKKKKAAFPPLCVPLGLKKPGDFTVSEGISLGFWGDRFGVKEKKKAGTGGLCPTVTGTH